MRGEWIRKPQGGASVIFVHGILSSGESCWLNANGTSWPRLLAEEDARSSLGIYVFTYETGIFSGTYRISDAVDALREHLRLDGVVNCRRLAFVCHSMGGIVVRKFIVEWAAELAREKKEIFLFLLASPSLGSEYASWLSPIAKVLGNSQGDALRFVRNNEWLSGLDKEFLNLKESRLLPIAGKELIEDKFIIFQHLFKRQVVEPFAGARYFGEPFKVPGSNHFSISKPENKDSIQHRLLCQFLKDYLEAVASQDGDQIDNVLTPATVGATSPVIVLPSIWAVNERDLDELFDHYEFNWPNVAISWPPACESLVKIIDDAIKRFDEEGAGLEGSEKFIREAPTKLADTLKERKLVESNLPDLVEMLRAFPLFYAKRAVRNHLLIADHFIHKDLAFIGSWTELARFGFKVPESLLSIATMSAEEAYNKIIIGEPHQFRKIYRARLENIGKFQIRWLSGGYIYVFASQDVFYRPFIDIKDDDSICSWLIPQVEYDRLSNNYAGKPETYREKWTITVVKDENGKEL
jgi:hypothetical protein